MAEDKKKYKNKEAHLFTRIVIQQVKEIYLSLCPDLHIFLDGLVGEGSHEKIKKGGYESQNTSKHLKIIHHYIFFTEYYITIIILFNLVEIEQNFQKYQMLLFVQTLASYCSTRNFW